jgi:hypothetical protein
VVSSWSKWSTYACINKCMQPCIYAALYAVMHVYKWCNVKHIGPCSLTALIRLARLDISNGCSLTFCFLFFSSSSREPSWLWHDTARGMLG